MTAFHHVTSLALAAMFVSAAAFAQQPRTVARLIDLEGTVLVSEGDAMAAGKKDQRLKVDARIVTTAGSRVTVNYDKGCDVRLDENKRFTVRELGECGALIATVESLGPTIAAAGGLSDLGILGALGVGGAILYNVGRTGGNNVSPN